MESTRLEKRGIERTIRTKHESQHESINFHYNNNSLNAPIVANYSFPSRKHLNNYFPTRYPVFPG